MIAAIAMSIGTTARNEAKTKHEHDQRAQAAEHGLEQHAGPVAVAALLLERVVAGEVDRRAGDALAARARRSAWS